MSPPDHYRFWYFGLFLCSSVKAKLAAQLTSPHLDWIESTNIKRGREGSRPQESWRPIMTPVSKIRMLSSGFVALAGGRPLRFSSGRTDQTTAERLKVSTRVSFYLLGVALAVVTLSLDARAGNLVHTAGPKISVPTPKPTKTIELNSWQFGVSRGISQPSASNADREGSTPSVSEIVVQKPGTTICTNCKSKFRLPTKT
jgi:hypothetical protein